jgi:hypothetical protein
MLYTAKMSPHDAPIFDLLQTTPEQVERARERETILQFVLRTSLRMPESTAPVTLNLYDAGQAHFVGDILTRHYNAEVEYELVEEAGIADIPQPKAGRKPVQVSPAQQAQQAAERRLTDRDRKQEKRKQEKEAKIAAGTYRGPGKPKKKAA